MASHGKGVPEASQVGDYIVEYEIGRGSFATVYKGHHKVGLASITHYSLANMDRHLSLIFFFLGPDVAQSETFWIVTNMHSYNKHTPHLNERYD